MGPESFVQARRWWEPEPCGWSAEGTYTGRASYELRHDDELVRVTEPDGTEAMWWRGRRVTHGGTLVVEASAY